MTTLFPIDETCFNCGTVSQFTVVGSTNTFGGHPDLDTRPPEMARSTIRFWVRRCPSCGYCAPEISRGSDLAKTTITSEAYRGQLNSPRFPELANSFLCQAILLASEDDHAGAGWAALRAAWACDDAHLEEAASCRTIAAEHFNTATAVGQSYAVDPSVEQAILADLLRRSNQFQKAIQAAEEGLARCPDDLARRVLVFQKALAEEHDADCHTIAEARQYWGNAPLAV